jgi:hypothetical protein
MRKDLKPKIKCLKCGVWRSSKGKYCKPCGSEVREEASRILRRR